MALSTFSRVAGGRRSIELDVVQAMGNDRPCANDPRAPVRSASVFMGFLVHTVRRLFRNRVGKSAGETTKEGDPEADVAKAVDLSAETEATQRSYRRLMAMRDFSSRRD